MKTINDIISELNITGTETVDQLLAKISLVTTDELNGIKTISVMPLPNVVKDRATELKNRLINIVSNEEKGAVGILNKRIALLYAILGKYSTILTNLDNRLTLTDNAIWSVELNSTNYVVYFKNKSGETIAQIDLPVETLFNNVDYDNETKELILIKENNSTIRVALGDLIDTYTGDGVNISVNNNIISFTQAFKNIITNLVSTQTTHNNRISELESNLTKQITVVNSLPTANSSEYNKNLLYMYDNELYYIEKNGASYSYVNLNGEAITTSEINSLFSEVV